MDIGIVLGLLLLAALAIANAFVTAAVVRSHYYSSRQKVMQALLVWLLPLLGALAVGVFLYSQRDNPMFDTRAYPEPSEKAVPYVINPSAHGHDQAP